MTRARDVANIDGILTTTGDTYYASAAATPERRAIGTTGQVLTVSGGVPTWATPASGSMTLLSTTALSGSSTTISSISGSYQTLFVHLQSFQPSANASLDMRINSDSGSNYFSNGSFGGNTVSSTGTTYRWALDCATDRQTWNNQFIQFNNYANTSNRKFIMSYGAHANQNSGFVGFNYYTGLWANTGAINSLTFLPAGGASWSGGFVFIYGVN